MHLSISCTLGVGDTEDLTNCGVKFSTIVGQNRLSNPLYVPTPIVGDLTRMNKRTLQEMDRYHLQWLCKGF